MELAFISAGQLLIAINHIPIFLFFLYNIWVYTGYINYIYIVHTHTVHILKLHLYSYNVLYI